ncbi:expressed unknown protein [Seminavis robusta]|uniref:PUB domain-containing protein n=1 Tax=Seminavis robusta TaxID=568900 RepID=A0A9N8H2Z1_9STRA|nr:expressed unknown protein [Seminavis robusta]|eukprot:Sro76_g041620.1 n/a (363) ;mRNA; f:54935-56023
MAELKRSESECQELLALYVSLHRPDPSKLLSIESELEESHPALVAVKEASSTSSSDSAGGASVVKEEEVLKALESIDLRLKDLEPRMQKMGKRLEEKDPISGAPRYGAKTAERVRHLLALFQALQKVVGYAFGLSEEESLSDGTNSDDCVVARLRETVAAQKAQEAAQGQQQEKLKEAEERRKLEEEERQRQQEEQKRLQAEQERKRQEEEIAQRAEASRLAARQAQEAAAQAERDWINSIPKGPEGVRTQMKIIKQSTQDDPQAKTTALQALLTIFTQIAQKPEEINFRRIRRDHPKFHQDIGRHKGGRELLIAAGFKLQTLDDIPCFFSKEPDLETDMDGWSLWFDNLKANLQVVQEEIE